MPSSSTIQSEIEKSRRDVLDLSLRNPLLNFRPSKRRGVQVVDELSRELFAILVGNGRVMYFRPAPEGQPSAPDAGEPTDTLDDVPAELLALLAEPAQESGETAARHTDNKLQTALTTTALNLRLRETFRQARLSIEEQGVNILYLALGSLRWYESDTSETERRAPLVLIPVQLARSGVRENFKLTWTKDDIEANLSLEAKLKQDFAIRLPEMPAEDDLDVDEYLSRVEKAVARQERWSVERNEVHLNFFSFSKLLIYKDLDPKAWPEENQPADHPLVGQLFGSDGFAAAPPDIGDEEPIDDDQGVAGLHPVMDADSSQTLAVLDVINGRNLVIQGPPGTGKSQTITNLVGEALARDRKVLFVAEKMAALEVVKRRLDTVHLGDACLELHSHKTNKRAVLDELRRTLAMGRPKTEGGAENGVLLSEARARLNDYAREVNQPVGRSEMTPHELIGRLARLQEDGLAIDGPALPIQDSVEWSGEAFVRRREVVREIQELVRSIGNPGEHLWWPCGRLHFVPTDAHSIREVLAEASVALDRLGSDAQALAKTLGVDTAFGKMEPAAVETMIHTARRAAAAPPLSGADHRNPDWVAQAGRIAEVAHAARGFAGLRSKHDAVLIPEAWDENVLAERQALRACGDKWWRFLSRPFRDARRRVQGLCRAAPPATPSASSSSWWTRSWRPGGCAERLRRRPTWLPGCSRAWSLATAQGLTAPSPKPRTGSCGSTATRRRGSFARRSTPCWTAAPIRPQAPSPLPPPSRPPPTPANPGCRRWPNPCPPSPTPWSCARTVSSPARHWENARTATWTTGCETPATASPPSTTWCASTSSRSAPPRRGCRRSPVPRHRARTPRAS